MGIFNGKKENSPRLNQSRDVYSPRNEVDQALTRTETKVGLNENQADIFEVNKERIRHLTQEFRDLKRRARGGKTPEARAALKIIESDLDNIIKKLEAVKKKTNKLNRLDHRDASEFAKVLKDCENLLKSGEIDRAIQKATLGEKVKIWTPIHTPKDAKNAQNKSMEVRRDNIER